MELHHGDCLEKLSTVESQSVDLVILDLPYGETKNDWDLPIDLDKLWEQLKRIGKERTPYVFFCSTRFGYQLIKSNETWFRYDLVWNKVNCSSSFLNAKIAPMRNHEMIYVFYNKFYFNIADNHNRIKECVFSQEERSNATNYNAAKKITKGVQGPVWNPKLPTSILTVPNKRTIRHQHSTEKAEGILEWIIRYYSKDGDLVVDPTMGSGTTGIVARRLHRRFIGIEKNEDIFRGAQQRLEIATLA